MTSASLAAIFSAWFAFAASANAQLAESDSASERDNRAAAPTPPTPGISEEALPADNRTAATANSLVHLPDGRIRGGRQRLAVRLLCSSHLAGKSL